MQASKGLVVAKVLQSQRTLATSSWLAIRPQGMPKDDSPGSFKPKRALILTKVSRYEFERRRMEQANQDGKRYYANYLVGTRDPQEEPKFSEISTICLTQHLIQNGQDHL